MHRNAPVSAGSAPEWLFRVAVSSGAALLVALACSMSLRPTGVQPGPAPELTSGGKYAARIPGAASPTARDGLDASAPQVSAPTLPASVVAAPVSAGGLDPVAAAKPGRAPARVGDRQTPRIEVRPVAAAPEPAPRDPGEAIATDATPEGANGLFQKVANGTRVVWTATTAAGERLLMRTLR